MEIESAEWQRKGLMVCQDCGVEAETKHVVFYQNIGALIVHFSKSVEGYFCKSCIHGHFWAMTMTTLLLGWWGMISFFLTPIFLLNNLGRYLTCLGMHGTPPGAAPPVLNKAVVDQIEPHADDLYRRLNAGEDFSETVATIATLSDVSPGQVMLYLDAMAQAQARK